MPTEYFYTRHYRSVRTGRKRSYVYRQVRYRAPDVCAADLLRNALHRIGGRWTNGERTYQNVTIERLISKGIAVRDGDIVRAA